MVELKTLNCTILESILYVKTNQNCSLEDATGIVVNSSPWRGEKDRFVNHQYEQMTEFMGHAKDDIECIEQVIRRTDTIIKIKK